MVVGGGAAGTLAALHLVRTASRRGTPLDLAVVDPAFRLGRGTAYGTEDERHLLNVPASGMSALPENPGHFVAWRRKEGSSSRTEPLAFASRSEFGRYLEATLDDAVAAAPADVGLRHVRSRATGIRRTGDGLAVTTDRRRFLNADAVVVATGLPSAGDHWAPAALRDSPFFVPDPWAPGALGPVQRDRVGHPDVVLVGTGLTMVDVAVTLGGAEGRPGRCLHGISRHGRLPRSHREEVLLAAIPDVSDWGESLESIRERVRQHVERVRRSAGDWRPAVDGLRHQVATLWARLSEDDRTTFLAEDAGAWNVLRHRMAPGIARRIADLRENGQLRLTAGEVADAAPLPGGGLSLRLRDGREVAAGWVVNCTGPRLDVRTLGDPFLDDLLRDRPAGALAQVATAGMGVRTADGRVVDGLGGTDPTVWTLGALRRGELWESTAVPEIRSQAASLASAVLDAVAPLPRRLADGRLVSGHHPIARPRDPLGMPLSTTTEAAAAYNSGLERLMLLQSGGEQLVAEAATLDPHFAVAHATLAMLGHEAGAATDVRASLAAAQQALQAKGDDRERSLVELVRQRVRDPRHRGARALFDHIAHYPRDVLAVSAAVPTIAFSGVIDVQQEAWDLVEGLAPSYGDHWWYISLLAFVRQDQGRYDEAHLLAESALSCEPSSGHAVHALTHVLYETGEHQHGLSWLDNWIEQSGRAASHRAHFSWHAALHELTLGDTEAVRRRYYAQLAPPAVTGVRALVDSASLLWRWRVAVAGWEDAVAVAGTGPRERDRGGVPPVGTVLEAVDPALLDRPGTPFVALHAALALAASGDVARVSGLAKHCRDSADRSMRAVVAPVCDALGAVVEERWADAAYTLQEVLPHLVRVGGSLAQREVVEETLLLCLVNNDRSVEAATLLGARLDRRPSPLDAWRAGSLASEQVTESVPS